MKTLRASLFLLTVSLCFSACQVTSTGSDPTPANAPKSELLAGKLTKSWLVISTKIDGKEVFNQAKACSKDDILVFKADKTYEWNDGASKCKATDVQVYEKGTWEFNSSETEMIWNKKDTYKVLELGSSTLRTSFKNVFGEVEEQTYQAQSN